MKQLISRFDRLSQSFPEVIIKSADELGKIEHEIVDTFDDDLKCIKRVLKEKKISININFKKFENPIYLYKKALYLQSEIPHSFENIVKFYLANLFICKQVLESIIRYMRELRRYIENTHNDYLTSKSNRLIKSWYQFIGCCENTVNIILDYEAFYEQIQIKLGTLTKATRLNFPSRYDITEAVKQSLINAGKGRYVLLPSVRLALEFSIVEDIGIKIKQQLKDKRCYHDITDLIFTRKMKADELFDIMVDMKLCTDNEIDTIKRIHEWGSRTVHQGQIVPLSLVWYCLFFVEEDIRRILREESKLKYNENLETFRKLLFDGKIDVIHDWQTFIPSFYNIS